MKRFIKPEIEVLIFADNDLIVTSPFIDIDDPNVRDA